MVIYIYIYICIYIYIYIYNVCMLCIYTYICTTCCKRDVHLCVCTSAAP